MSAIQLWNRQVKAHHAQSIRAQAGQQPSADFWQPFAPSFQADPRRTDDAVLNRLLREVTPPTTVLDVGGGGGRYALPLALRCRHVTVVEPSASMVEVLRQGAQEAGIRNITVIQATWEEADVAPADLVLCAHVLYGVDDVEPFVRKLHSHARDRVLILIYMDFPQVHLALLWKPVHGEDRINLPALRELLPVLWQMDIYPDLEMMGTRGSYEYDTWEDAQQEFHRRLYVNPDTDADRHLQQAMHDLLQPTPDGFLLRCAQPRRLGLLSWQPLLSF